MKKIKEKEEITYIAGVITFLIVSYLYGIKRVYGFSLFPDEFGYWASAARLVGYDWSEVSSLGSYYSFGYSLILAPILCIFRDALWAYRAAVTVNAILLVASFFLMNHILERLLPNLQKKVSDCICRNCNMLSDLVSLYEYDTDRNSIGVYGLARM